MIGSFFAGIGGIDLAFEQAGFQVAYANEIDEYAATTYNLNFDIQVDVKDIKDININNLPEFNILTAGFPCQAFSIAGYRQGFNDEKGRGNLFFDIVNILERRDIPIVFLENVKNLVTHDKGNTFRIIISELKRLGYYTKYQVLNSSEYGNIPQNRERIYIVAFKDVDVYNRFNFPEQISLTNPLSKFIDYENEVAEKYYYKEGKCLFYKELEKSIKNHSTIYQWRRVYVRENKNNLCPTLTANMGMGGHNVPIIYTYDKKFRKLTPKECFNLQGFPKDYQLPNNIADSKLYKQAGNSVVVPVVKRIAENIYKVMKGNYKIDKAYNIGYQNRKLAVLS